MMRILSGKRYCQLVLAVVAGVALLGADAQAYSYGSWGSSGSYGSAGRVRVARRARVGYASSGSYGSGSYGSASSGSASSGSAGSVSAGSYGSTTYVTSYASSGSYGSAGSYASSGSYGAASYGAASYGSASYGSAGSSGRVTILDRMAVRRQARIENRVARRAAYGCAGSYGSAGSVSSGSVSYGSTGSYGSTSYSVPVEYSTPVEAGCDCNLGVIVNDSEMLAAGNATIEVELPANAKVYVNNVLTTSTGSSRSYVSNNLTPGKTYVYKLRVEFEQAGRAIVKHETVKLQAGNKIAMQFKSIVAQPALATRPATQLKLNVPENARVLLSGALTNLTGSERTFTTHQLAAGQEWNNYVVRVEITRDGQLVVEERTLTVEAGESYELAFDFKANEPTLVAQAN